eukprot:scaffold31652_cov59-Phaeocystis_antarctica.AAC.5
MDDRLALGFCGCAALVQARHLVLGVEAIAPVQLGQHLLRLAHRLERAARRLGVGTASLASAAQVVGLDDGRGRGEVQGRAVVDVVAAEEAERRAHGDTARGAGVLDGGLGPPRARHAGGRRRPAAQRARAARPDGPADSTASRYHPTAWRYAGRRGAGRVASLWQRLRPGGVPLVVERGERAQPAHLGRQRHEACAGEVERGERAQPAHLGRQRHEACAGEVERGERAQPAHLGRQRREGCVGEVERGERAQRAHLSRQRLERAAVEVERGEREQPAHHGRQRLEGCAAEVERGEREQPAHLGRQRHEVLAVLEVELANLPLPEGHALPFVGRLVLGPPLTQRLTRTTEQRQRLHLLRRGLDAPGSKVLLHLLLQLLQRPLQMVPPLLQFADLLELGVELP